MASGGATVVDEFISGAAPHTIENSARAHPAPLWLDVQQGAGVPVGAAVEARDEQWPTSSALAIS
jgi:hypothetical protein